MTRGGRTKDRTEPERRCVATGASGPTEDLIRFVADPDGVLTPDLAERLPGRGVWPPDSEPEEVVEPASTPSMPSMAPLTSSGLTLLPSGSTTICSASCSLA